MKISKTVSFLAVAAFAFSGVSFAAGVSDYQVTGQITEMNDTMIAVMKSKEKFEIARDANTKAAGEMKVGDKVTIHYTMTATSIEAKPAKAAKADKADATKK